VRCFLAIELPTAAVSALQAASAAIRNLEPAWAAEKWATPEVMHVTVKFLGEVDATAVDRLATGFGAAAAEQQTFSLGFSTLRALPKADRAAMIWAVAEDLTGDCAVFARTAHQIAAQNGAHVESRKYAPHVTLVRSRRPRAVARETLAAAAVCSGLAELSPVSVLSATLFASTLTARGPIHERLAEFALGTG
jgi:2'-5' RNA ligase